MDATLARPKVLVLNGSQKADPVSLASLAEGCETVRAADLAEALRLLKRGSYDAVLVHPDLLTGPERNSLSGRLMLMLDRIGEGVCLLDESGELTWTNRRFREWGPSLAAQVREGCRRAAEALRPEDSRCAETRFAVTDESGRQFEVHCNPMHDPVDAGMRVLAIVRDETAARNLQRKIDAIDRAGRELMRIDRESVAKLDVPQRLDMLEQKIKLAAHQLLNFDHFNIRLLDKKTRRLVSVISNGLPDKAEVELMALPEGNGISGWVAATGRSYICTDIHTDRLYRPGLEQARSSLTVPLRLEDEVVGVFNIESREPDRFREEDRQFAEIFGRYVAIALNVLELLVVERYRTTGLLAEDLAQEISGPLNDIITDTTSILDDADAGLAKRLKDILGNVDKIRASLRAVGAPTGGLLGAVACDTSAPADPVLDGKRVLVADDEAAIRETIADVLACHGCKVDQAPDGAAAGDLVAKNDYDLVLSDIRMPHKNGYEVFTAAKEKNAKTAVILMTGFGYDPNHSVVKARREGLSAVMFKPFKVAALLDQVRAAITAPAAAPAPAPAP